MSPLMRIDTWKGKVALNHQAGGTVIFSMESQPQNSILQPFFVKVHTETCADRSIARHLAFVQGFAEEWAGNFLHPLSDNLHRARVLESSVFYCYLSSQTNVLVWLETSLLCGLYEVVMRELRTVLEGMFPAFYLELSNPGVSLEIKLTRLRELEDAHRNHGKIAFKMSRAPEWHRYYELYKQLCSYTHMSTVVAGANMRKVATEGYAEIPDFHFDRVLFVKCAEMWDQVARLALGLCFVIMERLKVEHIDLIVLPSIKTISDLKNVPHSSLG